MVRGHSISCTDVLLCVVQAGAGMQKKRQSAEAAGKSLGSHDKRVRHQQASSRQDAQEVLSILNISSMPQDVASTMAVDEQADLTAGQTDDTLQQQQPTARHGATNRLATARQQHQPGQ